LPSPGFSIPVSTANEGNDSVKILSMVVVLTAMVSLNGGIIAFFSALLMDFLDTIRSGTGKLRVSNHILILNWSSEVGEILVSYYHDTEPTTAVILSDKPRPRRKKPSKRVSLIMALKPGPKASLLCPSG
jgi:hypothetical protein